MKKVFALFAVFSVLMLSTSDYIKAQDVDTAQATEDTVSTMQDEAQVPVNATEAPAEQTLNEVLKSKFIEGGPLFMTPILLCLILGLALVIERMIYLNLSSTNTEKLLLSIEEALQSGGVDAAKEVCRNTPGPVASIFYQGLDRSHEGIDIVEKTVVSYGGVQMSLLEKNLSWIGLFISLAPMLGFFGTVVGMVDAFDAISLAGDVSPSLVAGGIKIALITTVGGLIVAMILQVFYSYLISKIDSLVTKMEDASISLVDILVKYNLKK